MVTHVNTIYATWDLNTFQNQNFHTTMTLNESVITKGTTDITFSRVQLKHKTIQYNNGQHEAGSHMRQMRYEWWWWWRVIWRIRMRKFVTWCQHHLGEWPVSTLDRINQCLNTLIYKAWQILAELHSWQPLTTCLENVINSLCAHEIISA